jgi:hypothetical protein
MTDLSCKNVILAMPLSFVIGTGLGIVQDWLARMLAAGETGPVRQLRLEWLAGHRGQNNPMN